MSTVRLFATAVLGILLLVPPGDGWGARRKKAKTEDVEEKIDYVALAAKMVKDGHFDRAEAMLKQVDLKQEGMDLPRYHTLYGLVKLKQSQFAPARDHFQAAVKAGQKEKVVHLFLAQAYFGLEDWKNVVTALDRAGAEVTDKPDVFGMRARAHWKLSQHQKAFDALDAGLRRHPDAGKLLRLKVFHLIELTLYQEAVEIGQEYLARPDVGPDDYVAMGEALRQARQFEQSRVILGQAKLRYPDDMRIVVQLARTYVDEEKYVPAAMLFEEAARADGKYRADAAELYRRAGRLDLALALNAGVEDQAEKMKQRLAILLKMERFDLIAPMEPRLSRLGLLEKEDVRYALAYALYKSGDYAASERHLKELRDPSLFDKATQLRKAMESCRHAGWQCL